MLNTTDANFEQDVLNSDVPVLVDFWAPWCGPCKAIAPIVESVEREIGTRAKIVKVNTDEHNQWAARFGIMGIPTMIFFKGGKEVGRIVGTAPRQVIFGKLESLCETLDKTT